MIIVVNDDANAADGGSIGDVVVGGGVSSSTAFLVLHSSHLRFLPLLINVHAGQCQDDDDMASLDLLEGTNDDLSESWEYLVICTAFSFDFNTFVIIYYDLG